MKIGREERKKMEKFLIPPPRGVAREWTSRRGERGEKENKNVDLNDLPSPLSPYSLYIYTYIYIFSSFSFFLVFYDLDREKIGISGVIRLEI